MRVIVCVSARDRACVCARDCARDCVCVCAHDCARDCVCVTARDCVFVHGAHLR